MACCDGTLLGKLKSLIYDIEGGCCAPCCSPCCPPPCVPIPPNTQPFATCCMVCPPPICPPTHPEPVKPLRLPCPTNNMEPEMTEEEAERTRYANFYNNYNIDWHADSANAQSCGPSGNQDKCKGVTLDGKAPCEDYKRKKPSANNADQGCPTGFKTCSMKLTPPANCHPCGVWCAEIQPCPPKPKKKVSKYEPGPCKRKDCKHWKSKDGDCKYDDVCKAHCYNHPPGIKPKKQQQSQQLQSICG